jgi:hypothetical protein
MVSDCVIVVDLDGTLLKVNSFPRWVLHLFVKSLRHARIDLSLTIARALMGRKTGALPHSAFKQILIELQYPETWDRDYVLGLSGVVRWDLVNRIAARGGNILIATAAPLRYAKYLPDILGHRFASVLGSEIVGNKLRDNCGANKLDAVREHTGAGQIPIAELYTDHHDDLPLARQATRVVLVAPSEETMVLMAPYVHEIWGS